MSQIKYIFICISLAVLCSSELYSQKIGSPIITNFTPKDYKAGSQNWSAVQDSIGRIFFANQRGILIYNGLEWELVEVLDGKTVFELKKDDKGKIWCGVQDDFGYLSIDSIGVSTYKSLGNLIPDSLKPIGKIRDIEILNEAVYFSSPKYLFKYKDNNLRTWKSLTAFYRQYIYENNLLIFETKKGVKKIVGDSLVIENRFDKFINNPIMDMVKYSDDKYLIGTWKEGLFLYDKNNKNHISQFNSQIKKELFTNPPIDIEISDEKIVIAGFNYGSYIINKSGQMLYKLNKSKGLINELCNKVLVDKSNAVWLINNFGISRVEPFSPFIFIGEKDGLVGNVINLFEFNNSLIILTDNKIYKLKFEENKLEEIPNIDLCWDGIVVKNELLFAGNPGVYIVKNDQKRLLEINQKKCFTLVASKKDTNLIYIGTESGISIIQNVKGEWVFSKEINGISEEVRQIIETEDDILWIFTLGSGVIKYDKNLNVITGFGISDGLRDLKFYKGIEINNKIYFYSNNSPILKFSEEKQKFIQAREILNEEVFVSRMTLDNNKSLWIQKIKGKNSLISKGVINSSGGYDFNSKIFKRIENINTKKIIVSQNGQVWIGHQFGIINYNPDQEYKILKPFPTYISQVQYKDSLVSKNNQNTNIKFPFKENSVRVTFSLPSYENRKALKFQYYLENFEEDWSNWKNENTKEYTNLFDGQYVFHVRGKDVYGNISPEDTFSFSIVPPWYRSSIAYVSYFILFLFGLYFIDKIRTKQVTKQNEKEHQRKLDLQKQIDIAKSEERQKIRQNTARDFHDDLGHILTKISLYTELAKKKSNSNNKFLSKVEMNTSLLSSGVKDLIWTLDNQKDSLYDLLVRIKEFGEELFEHTDIIFQSSGFSEQLSDFKISMEKRKNILLIFKEAMNNCLKYSHSSNANFIVDKIHSDIKITFSDNGKGFDLENCKYGNGITNMKSRAENINAKFDIFSKPGMTKLIVTIKNYTNE